MDSTVFNIMFKLFYFFPYLREYRFLSFQSNPTFDAFS